MIWLILVMSLGAQIAPRFDVRAELCLPPDPCELLCEHATVLICDAPGAGCRYTVRCDGVFFNGFEEN